VGGVVCEMNGLRGVLRVGNEVVRYGDGGVPGVTRPFMQKRGGGGGGRE